LSRRLPDDPAELTALFVESIVKQDEAIRHGGVKSMRAFGDTRVRIARKLVSLGDDAKEQFAALFVHENRIARVAAAVYLFHCMPDRTFAAMREVAEGDDFAAYCARLRIKEWEERPEGHGPENWR
jgi:hypothetical protein